MVNVGDKPESLRTAVASGRVTVNESTFALIKNGCMKKGDVLAVAHVLKPPRKTTRPMQAAQNSALRARRVSEKAGKSELEQLRFSHDFVCFCPNIRKNHCFRCLKTVVL